MSNLITLLSNMCHIKTWEDRSKEKKCHWRCVQKTPKICYYFSKSWLKLLNHPSRKILSKTSSKANSTALRAANAFTSMTVGGSWITSDSEAITKPSWLRITTPKSATFSFSKIAPSKLILYPCRGGGVHYVACLRAAGAEMGQGRHPIFRSLARFRSWYAGIEGFPSHRLFRRFHNAQTTEEKSSGSLFSAQIKNIISKKLVHYLMVP